MILIENLCVKLGDFVLDNVNLNIHKGQFFAILGPTGAGKSVILEAIAGLKPIKSGKIIVNGRNITNLKPEERAISICYQDYCLFPHLTVKDNIEYGLRFRKNKKNPKHKKNFNMLVELLKIEHILNRYPQNLSGGEKQRVSLARALIVEPDVLLLDEPLSALDPNIKERIQNELKKIHEILKITAIMVTHDFKEAHFLADNIAIINEGCIIQQGTVEEIFQKPKSRFVADFVGIKTLFKIDENTANEFEIDYPCHVGIRSEKIRVAKRQIKSDFCFKGKVISIVDTGIYVEVKIEYNKRVYTAYLTMNYIHDLNLTVGNEVYFGFNKEDLNII